MPDNKKLFSKIFDLNNFHIYMMADAHYEHNYV